MIQNNKYAISVPVEDQLAGGSIYKIGTGYEGLNCFQVDGTDFIKSYSISEKAVNFARNGKGPSLIEAETVRLLPHSSSDSDKKYKKQDEIEQERAEDPIPKFELYLLKQNITDEEELDKLRKNIKEEIDIAAKEAENSALPTKESVTHFLFAPENDKSISTNEPNYGEKVVLVDAINHALKEEMKLNENIYVFGQDVADGKGGVFTATSGLSTMFGNERCFNAPLAESSIVGAAIGMAVRGLKPVIEIQFGDYIWTAMMQVRNELATIRWRSNNHWSCPVIIRVPVGGYIHGGLCHSQNIEGFFSHLPGIKIIYPSRADDAKGLLKSAIRGENPVLFLEHKALYRHGFAATPEPDENYLLPLGKASVYREGVDATVITYGMMVNKSMDAARELQKQGYEIEIIDIRTINPLDTDTILKSVQKTSKVLVLHEDSLYSGFGAEIAAQIAELSFDHLDAPIKRLAAKDVPIGFSPVLEDETLPQTENILESLKSLLEY